MDLSNPIRSVVPAAHADVLAVLARTEQPLTGRGVAELTDGRVSQKGVNLVLRALDEAGLVTVETHPPAKLYRLNRQHLAAASIEALATMRERMIDSMRQHLRTWSLPPWGAWLFGSAARGGGDETSDIDVLVVRPDEVSDDDPRWLEQLERLTDDVAAWTGNRCEIVEYAVEEFRSLMQRSDRLAVDLRSDAIALTDRSLPSPSPTSRSRR